MMLSKGHGAYYKFLKAKISLSSLIWHIVIYHFKHFHA